MAQLVVIYSISSSSCVVFASEGLHALQVQALQSHLASENCFITDFEFTQHLIFHMHCSLQNLDCSFTRGPTQNMTCEANFWFSFCLNTACTEFTKHFLVRHRLTLLNYAFPLLQSCLLYTSPSPRD